jgi:hypothetical protein
MSPKNNLNRTQLLSFSNPFVASVATILYLFLEDVLDGADDDADDDDAGDADEDDADDFFEPSSVTILLSLTLCDFILSKYS